MSSKLLRPLHLPGFTIVKSLWGRKPHQQVVRAQSSWWPSDLALLIWNQSHCKNKWKMRMFLKVYKDIWKGFEKRKAAWLNLNYNTNTFDWQLYKVESFRKNIESSLNMKLP